MKILLLLAVLLSVSCGKSDKETQEAAAAAPQKSLFSQWTKSDGSKVTNLEGLTFGETQYMTIRYFGPFVYNETMYDSAYYDCSFNTIWNGDEYSGEMIFNSALVGSYAFCFESESKEFLYQITGSLLTFTDKSDNSVSNYF